MRVIRVLAQTILVQSMYMLLPGAILYAIMKPGQKTEAELEQELKSKYAANIRKSAGQREAMQQ